MKWAAQKAVNMLTRAARDADPALAPIAPWAHEHYAALLAALGARQEDVISVRRSPSVVYQRQCLWWGMRIWRGPMDRRLSWHEIARLTGRVNHTSAFAGCRRLTEGDKAYVARVVAGLRVEGRQ